MKRYYFTFLLVIIFLFMFPVMASASDITDADYYGIIIIDNDGAATENVSVNLTLSSDNLVELGFVDSDFDNCALRNAAGADVPFMPSPNATQPACIFVPSIADSASINNILYTGPSSLNSTKYWFPGAGGGTIAYDVNLAPNGGTSWGIRTAGFFDTSAGSNKDIYYDANLCRIYVSAAGQIKLEYLGGGGGSLTANITSGYHTLFVVSVIAGNAEIIIDGASSANASCTPAGTAPTTITYVRNGVMPYVEYLETFRNGVFVQRIEWQYAYATYEDSIGSYDITPTFRTTSSDADVSAYLYSFQPIETAIAPGYTVSDAPDFITDNITASGNFTSGNVTTANFPGAAVVNAMAEGGGTPNIWLWGILAGVAIIGMNIMVALFSKTFGGGNGVLIFRMFSIILIFGLLISFNVFDWWMLLMFIFIAMAPAVASRHIDWGGAASPYNLIGFLAMAWVGMTTINRIIEGQFITSSETEYLNAVMFTQEFELFGMFKIPVLNIQFFTEGIPRLVQWDYSFFGGNAQIFQYLLYSLTALLAFILFTLIIGMMYNFFSRLR